MCWKIWDFHITSDSKSVVIDANQTSINVGCDRCVGMILGRLRLMSTSLVVIVTGLALMCQAQWSPMVVVVSYRESS